MTTLNMVLIVLLFVICSVVLLICHQVHKKAEEYEGLCGISENDTEEITIRLM